MRLANAIDEIPVCDAIQRPNDTVVDQIQTISNERGIDQRVSLRPRCEVVSGVRANDTTRQSGCESLRNLQIPRIRVRVRNEDHRDIRVEQSLDMIDDVRLQSRCGCVSDKQTKFVDRRVQQRNTYVA